MKQTEHIRMMDKQNRGFRPCSHCHKPADWVREVRTVTQQGRICLAFYPLCEHHAAKPKEQTMSLNPASPMWYFWYSNKQRELEERNGEESNAVLIDGKRIPYTMCSNSLEHGSLCGDEQLLGTAPMGAIKVHPSKFESDRWEDWDKAAKEMGQ